MDLSFHLQLKQGDILPSFNANTIKTAPKGAIDQLGHTLTRIIHAFAETEDDAKIFMAKWDIKDGFWRMYGKEGQEYNFAYVLLQLGGKQVHIVVPTSLQMGWVESPPFFCAASETARDVAQDYCETTIGSIPHVIGNAEYEALPEQDVNNTTFWYLLEVYVDDYVALVIPTSACKRQHYDRYS